MTPKRRFSLILAQMGLIVAGLVFGLGVAEIAARQLDPPYQGGDLHQCDRMLGWKGWPGITMTVETDGYQHQVSWNADGFHDVEHTLAKPDGVFRILVLGDSFVEASEVSVEQTSFFVLQETLNAQAPPGLKFEVISGGMRAWGPPQELIYFRARGQHYQPDLVLVMWLPANDLTDVLPNKRLTGSGINCYFPNFNICHDQFDPEPWFSAPGIPLLKGECPPGRKLWGDWLNWLYQHSRLYQQLEPVIERGFERPLFYSPYATWLEEALADPTVQYAYRMTDYIFQQLANEARQTGASTALVIVPFDVAVQAEAEASYGQVCSNSQ
ncbi:MAG: SGNH/GDSL hydrolase family protein, partial [Anaerolineales bacterium]|nr:SGNH/GDSL hydrolase family protein [Anaerolineales bacterium]